MVERKRWCRCCLESGLYRQEDLRQLNHALLLHQIKFRARSCPFPPIKLKTTINHFIQADDFSASASNLFTTTPRTPTCLYISYLTSLITLPDNTSLIPGRPIVSACSCPILNSYLESLTKLFERKHIRSFHIPSLHALSPIPKLLCG